MSDSEYEEEEFIVYADFKDDLLISEFGEVKKAIKIIGLEGKNPIAEVNGSIFKGTYDFAMGTNVFFEKDNKVATFDPLFETSCEQKYKYCAKTNKIINFERVYVESKSDVPIAKSELEAGSVCDGVVAREVVVEDIEEEAAGHSNNDNLKIDETYEEIINNFYFIKE